MGLCLVLVRNITSERISFKYMLLWMANICKYMMFTCALGARVIRIKSTKTQHKPISIVNRAPIWRTIEQLTQLKPTRHVTMKELYTRTYVIRGSKCMCVR